MNRTAFTASTAQRATAFVAALAVTLTMLGGIDGLAVQQHAGTELARQQTVEPAASGTAVALVIAPRS